MSTVIEIKNLYNEYHLGVNCYGILREDMQSWWARMRGKADPNSILFTINQTYDGKILDYVFAIDEINFNIKKGERLGIIGKNCVGKPTL